MNAGRGIGLCVGAHGGEGGPPCAYAAIPVLSYCLFCTIARLLDFYQGVPWCYDGDAWLLGGDFLIVWGARWGPLMHVQPYRWFTSWFLHQSFTHVLSNMLLFLVIAVQVLPNT